MQLLNIEYLSDFILENQIPEEVDNFEEIQLTNNQSKAREYKELIDFLKFELLTDKAISELKCILLTIKTLEQQALENWLNIYFSFFEANIIGFGLRYMDSGNDKDGNLHITSTNEYVEKNNFITIIQFWECMWLLYYRQYNMEIGKRKSMTNDYYYHEPDANEPSDLEKVLTILNIK